MILDPSIRLGDILPLFVYVIGAIVIVATMRGDLRMLGKEVEKQGIRIDKLEAIVVEQARHDQRLLNVEKLIDDLRRGRGWIRVSDRDGLDGEYPK